MQENYTLKSKSDQKKEKPRAKHFGLCADDASYILTLKQKNFFDDDSYRRIGIYARVAYKEENQISLFERQKTYYENLAKSHPRFILVDIYADEGVSGTSVKNRIQFLRLIEDCSGKIDVVIVKSVSKFARNIGHCLDYIRQLAELCPPVGVFFENEGLYTLNKNSEASFNLIDILTQENLSPKSSPQKEASQRSKYEMSWTSVLIDYASDKDEQ